MDIADVDEVDIVEQERENDPDDTGRNGQHHTGQIPETMQTDDGHCQDDLHALLYVNGNEDVRNHIERFESAPKKTLKLSKMKRMYLTKNKLAALSWLRSRSIIQVDDEFILSPDERDILPSVGPHYLDFCLFVGDRLGIDAILPNTNHDHTFSVDLCFNQWHVEWPSADARYLPFHAKGRMLKIGSRRQENVWLAMVPKSYMEYEHQDNDRNRYPRLDASKNAMEFKHSMMVTMFFAWALEQLRYRDIHCQTRYPDPLQIQTVRDSTEILGRLEEGSRTLPLTLSQCKDLHAFLRNNWEDWVDEAPDSWKRDGFLTSNLPIAITMRYGQNQEIVSDPDNAEDEEAVWEHDHTYKHLRQCTFSIASIFRLERVTQWIDVDPRNIMARHGQIYREGEDPVLDDEWVEVVDLAALPLLDEDQNEITIYDADGYRIPRRLPSQSEAHACWMNLSTAHHLFLPADDEYHPRRNTAMPFNAYPQAFLRTIGNLQSSSPPLPLRDYIKTLGQELSIPVDDENEDQDHVPNAIESVYFQSYNEISHRFRDEARFHPVQLGLLTSALGGTYNTTNRGLRKWGNRVDACRQALPHKRFENKIGEQDQPEGLRNEVTYTIHLKRLSRNLRDGGSIYNRIIKPLARRWVHPSVLQDLRRHVVSFRPNVLPKVYLWTTYPIVCFLEQMWRRLLPSLTPGQPVNQYMIEMVAMFERTLNFAHTGNARVLTRNLMDRAWLSMGCLADGMPCVSPDFIEYHSLGSLESISIQKRTWPVIADTRKPLTASKRALELTYGEQYYATYEARFTIIHGFESLPPTLYSSFDSVVQRRACYAIELAIRTYINDVKYLVQTKVMSELRPLLDSDDLAQQDYARERQQSLDTWLNQDDPLSFNVEVLSHLIRAVFPQDRGVPKLTTSHIGDKTRFWFAQTILDACSNDNPNARRKPPFIQDGYFRPIMLIAIHEIKQTAERNGLSASEACNAIKQAIEFMTTHLKISHIPWSADPMHPGRPASTLVTHHTWVNFASTERATHILPNNLLTRGESSLLLANRTAEEMNLRDRYGEWNTIDVPFSKFATVLHKYVPPIQLIADRTTFQMGNNYTKPAYIQMLGFYDGSKPLHQLALFCGYIMASLAPDVYRPIEYPTPVPYSSGNPDVLGRYLRNLPWTPRPSQGGALQSIHYITAATTFFISILDSSSPIRARLRTDQKFSGQWLSKHRNKGITVLAMCRLGLARATSTRIMESARWYEDIQMLGSEEMEALHTRITTLLKNNQYGVYDAVKALAGDATAKKLAESGAVTARREPNNFRTSSQLASTSVASSSKHKLDDDDDDDVIIVEDVMTTSEAVTYTSKKRKCT